MTSTELITHALQPARPEFVRMPKPGSVCPWTGLGRSYLYQLAADGKIKTLCLRKRGASRGVRLIKLDSVIEFLTRAAEAEGAA